MTIRIIEEGWGVDRKTGNVSSRITCDRVVEISSPIEIGISVGKRDFMVASYAEGVANVTVINENNPSKSKSWTISRGESVKYTPVSRDGGYKYTIIYEK